MAIDRVMNGSETRENSTPGASHGRRNGAASLTGSQSATEQEIAALLGGLGSSPGYAEIQRVGNRLLKIQPPQEVSGSKLVRVALASSFTIDPMAAALAVECFRTGLWPVIKVDGFNQFLPHILDSESDLFKFRPEIVFLAAELNSLVPDLEGKTDSSLVDEAGSQLNRLISEFRRNSSALLVIHNFSTRQKFPFAIVRDERLTRSIRAVNNWLADQFATDPQVKVLDFESLCAYHGMSRVTNPLLHYLGGMEISETFLPVLAKQYLAFIRGLKGLVSKCLVLDLDGTLWGGVVGEEGAAGVHLARYGPGSEYRDFQAAILALHERGVILAINSKNNPDDALEVLRNHPDMLLREQHFASIRINWDDKVSNLLSIAEEINIGLDSLVFVDDSPTERQWVSHELPEVKVFDLPADPKVYARALAECTEFEALSNTREDQIRAASYVSARERRELQAKAGSFENFLASLKTVLSIRIATPEDFARVGQLTRKTNQFNMTTRRYTDAAIYELGTQEDSRIYVLNVRDVFGEYGLVGVMIFRAGQEAHKIDVLLMSCRVLGRGIERVFVANVLHKLKEEGIAEILAEYIPSSKNGIAASFYENLGFVGVPAKKGSALWRLSLSAWDPPDSKWFTIEWK